MSGMSREQRDVHDPADLVDGLELAVEEPGEAEHQDVEGEPDDELVGGETMAHLGLHRSATTRPPTPDQQAERDRVGDVVADRAVERAREQHRLDRDVDRAGTLGDPLARRGEREQAQRTAHR